MIHYREVGENGKITRNHGFTACYSEVFRGGINEKTTGILLYEKDEVFRIPIDTIPNWVNTLNLCGFPCKYLGNNYKEYQITKGCHVFYIDCKDYQYLDHLCSTMTLLRYMFESNNYANVIDHFYKIKKQVGRISNFRALLMSFAYLKGDNHTCHIGRFNRKFVTRQQVFNKFAKGPKIRKPHTRSDIYSCWEMGKQHTFDISENYVKLYKIMEGNKDFKKGVFVVGGANNYANWLDDYEVVDQLEKADLVLFTGGEDVDPSMYKAPRNPQTQSNLKRDLREKEVYVKAKQLGLKCLGICRGSQFICVMNGGQLVQHQHNPDYIHEINTNRYGNLYITSTHHQAAYPFVLRSYDYQIIGYTKGMSKVHENGDMLELDPPQECEIVYYRNSNDLGIQGHPEHEEYQQNHKDSLDKLKTIFNDFVNRDL